jgi:hypothetical protein
MLADKIYTNLRAADVRRLLEYVVELTGIAAIYVGLAKLSLALASIHPSATPIWPPTGYALAVSRHLPWSPRCQRHNCRIGRYITSNCYWQHTRKLSRRLFDQPMV